MADRRPALIVACVQPRDLRPEMDPLTGAVRKAAGVADLSPSEAAAVELALELAGTWGGRVAIVAALDAEVDARRVPALEEFAACGGEVVLVAAPGEGEQGLVDEPALAGALAGAIRRLGTPDLVCCGDRTETRGTGALPALLAAELGVVQALGLSAVSDAGPGRLEVERRLEQGWKERLVVHAPAVVSVERCRRLRRAPLAGMLGSVPAVRHVAEPARTSPVVPGRPMALRPLSNVVPPPASTDSHARLEQLSGIGIHRDPPRIVAPASADEAAGELLDFLEHHREGRP